MRKDDLSQRRAFKAKNLCAEQGQPLQRSQFRRRHHRPHRGGGPVNLRLRLAGRQVDRTDRIRGI